MSPLYPPNTPTYPDHIITYNYHITHNKSPIYITTIYWWYNPLKSCKIGKYPTNKKVIIFSNPIIIYHIISTDDAHIIYPINHYIRRLYTYIYNYTYIYIIIYVCATLIYINSWDGFVVGAGFWGFVGSSWQQISLMLHQDIIYMPTILLQDLIYMIYIYMHTSKSFIQLGHKKQNILHMHNEKLHNAINGSMSFSQWISERKFNFALLRHAQMIGFCVLLCCRFL